METAKIEFSKTDYEIKRLIYELLLHYSKDEFMCSFVNSWQEELESETVLSTLKQCTNKLLSK